MKLISYILALTLGCIGLVGLSGCGGGEENGEVSDVDVEKAVEETPEPQPGDPGAEEMAPETMDD